MDPLSNAFSTILNNEKKNKRECVIEPASRLVGHSLRVLQQQGYVGEFEFIDDGRFGKFVVQLMGRMNKCGAIRPRHSVRADEFEVWERKYLPSRDVGILILTTSKGVMSHRDAMKGRIGGQLLAYVY